MSKISHPTFFAVLEPRAKKNGLYPVSLIVYYAGDKKRYRLGIYLSKDQWEKIHSRNLRDEKLKGIKADIQSFIAKANKVAETIDEFDFKGFEDEYFSEKQSKKINVSLKQVLLGYMATDENKAMRLKTKELYETAVNSVEQFKSNIRIKEINIDFLMSYEAYLTKLNKKTTTINIYMRQIRSLLNYAINEKEYLKPEAFPFGKKKYKIPANTKNKQALDDQHIKAIWNYTSPILQHEQARDFWIFSYLGNGMNFNDIARLRYSNIKGEYMNFVRTKTMRQVGSPKEISIFLLPKILELISKWGNKKVKGDEFIFPLLTKNMTEEEQNKVIANFIKTTNKYLKRISKELGFVLPVTTYWARHSYATKLKRSGATLLEISEGMGHSRTSTTEDYLDSFLEPTKKDNALLLLNLDSKQKEEKI